jgi:exodeoxyribonuclease VII large subunit
VRELPTPVPTPVPGQRDVYSVSRLNAEARRLLEASFREVWVEGEISNLSRPGSGHIYFTLKDDTAQVRCALFRQRRDVLALEPEAGARVLVRARVTLYENRGDFQLVVQHLEDAGEGALLRAFEQLKRKLESEGLFEPGRKRELPRFPRRVGIITSATGAAVRDVIATFRRRCPAVPLLIYPSAVQGAAAVPELLAALAAAQQRAECDALIVTRGGGSLEDLQAFNDESVARAIAAASIPIVSGVGHDIDFTISDFVADRRAPTPTAAAELLSPDAAEWISALAAVRRQICRNVRASLENGAQRVDGRTRRLIHPRERLSHLSARLQHGVTQLAAAANSALGRLLVQAERNESRLLMRSPAPRLERLRDRVERHRYGLSRSLPLDLDARAQALRGIVGRLRAVSPEAVLQRGYAVVTDTASGHVISSADNVATGASVDVALAHGALRCTVTDRRR